MDRSLRTACLIDRRCTPAPAFGSRWALAQMQSGTSLNAIQQLLGHRSPHTTSVYFQHIAPAAAVAEATAKTAHLAVKP
jgi:integrase